jgi:hypothetical protein
MSSVKEKILLLAQAQVQRLKKLLQAGPWLRGWGQLHWPGASIVLVSELKSKKARRFQKKRAKPPATKNGC